jgi:hypothetical protein
MKTKSLIEVGPGRRSRIRDFAQKQKAFQVHIANVAIDHGMLALEKGEIELPLEAKKKRGLEQ